MRSFGDTILNYLDCFEISIVSPKLDDAASGVFTADWSSVFIGGSFNNIVSHWHLEGIMLTEPPCLLPADSGDLNGDCKLDSADLLLFHRKVSGLQ